MKKYFKIVGVIFIIVAFIFIFIGFDKMNNYYNNEDYPRRNKNAYVGGDAYNYIINGTYATAYFTLASGCMISGVICFIGSGLTKEEKREEAVVEYGDELPPI